MYYIQKKSFHFTASYISVLTGYFGCGDPFLFPDLGVDLLMWIVQRLILLSIWYEEVVVYSYFMISVSLSVFVVLQPAMHLKAVVVHSFLLPGLCILY